MGKHTVQTDETPRDVAKRHTGDENRYLDLLPANPHLKTMVDGQTGRPNFDSKDWHDGLVVNIPERWSESGQMHGVKPSGSVGCGCSGGSNAGTPPPASGMVAWRDFLNRGIGSPYGYGYLGFTPGSYPHDEDNDPSADDYDEGYDGGTGTRETGAGGGPGGTCNQSPESAVKPYELLVLPGDTLWGLAVEWLGKSDVSGTSLYTNRWLQKVNVDRLQSDCSHLKGSAHDQIRIPQDWPACPESLKGRRVNANGTTYTEGEPPAPGKVPGGSDVDRINVTGASDSSLIWWLLAGGAAVAGAIVLSKKYKGRR